MAKKSAGSGKKRSLSPKQLRWLHANLDKGNVPAARAKKLKAEGKLGKAVKARSSDEDKSAFRKPAEKLNTHSKNKDTLKPEQAKVGDDPPSKLLTTSQTLQKALSDRQASSEQRPQQFKPEDYAKPKKLVSEDARYDWADEHRFPEAKNRLGFEAAEALRSYVRNGFSEINRSLREGNPSEEAKALAKGFESLPGLPTAVTLHRGVKLLGSERAAQYAAGIKVGSIIQDRGMMSTSFDPDVAAKFSDGVVFKIQAPKGKKAMLVESDEAELILPPSSSMMVRKKTKVGNQIVIHVDIID